MAYNNSPEGRLNDTWILFGIRYADEINTLNLRVKDLSEMLYRATEGRAKAGVEIQKGRRLAENVDLRENIWL